MCSPASYILDPTTPQIPILKPTIGLSHSEWYILANLIGLPIPTLYMWLYNILPLLCCWSCYYFHHFHAPITSIWQPQFKKSLTRSRWMMTKLNFCNDWNISNCRKWWYRQSKFVNLTFSPPQKPRLLAALWTSTAYLYSLYICMVSPE